MSKCGTNPWLWLGVKKNVNVTDAPKSLPIFAPGGAMVRSSRIADGIYIAGDYRSAPSQNGALLSGRLAAEELLFDQRR